MGASIIHHDNGEATAREPISESIDRRGGCVVQIQAWFGRHPLWAIGIIAALAVTLSSYPVIFCGKSYVSPVSVYATALVYDHDPCLPGMPRMYFPCQHYSDTGAMMWWAVPVGFIESRSILDHGEIPRWDRYGHAGYDLLGQAVSMLGDPLQLVVIAGRGAALAWDIKFLLAKLLFCLGFGWLVLRQLENLGLSLIYTALAAWCGAYIYIGSHPAFFVLAYAPWILLSALEMLSRPAAGRFKWGFTWLAANCSCFNAGHVELAVILIGGLNLAALSASLASVKGFRDRAAILARMAGGTLLFLGLTAPVWISLLTDLQHAYATTHDTINVTQIPPANISGVFDDSFYRYRADAYLAAPGTSLLVLVGCIFSLRRWRQFGNDRFFWVNLGTTILWAGFVFGGVPARVVAVIPFLNRVGHVHVDFSYLLVIQLTLQSAYGFKSLLQRETLRQMSQDFIVVLAVMEIILMEYYWSTHDWPFHLHYFLYCMGGAVGAPLLFKCLQAWQGRMRVLGWLGIILLGFIPNYRFGLYNSGDDLVLMLPGSRMTLNAPSPALTEIKNDPAAFRVTGMGMILAGDYAAVYGFEDIRSTAPLSNQEYVELVRNFPGFKLATNDWAIKLLDPGQARPLLNLLNVKYVLADSPTNPPGSAQFTIRHFADFTVLENSQAWPRAFFANQIVPVSSNEEFSRHLLQNGDQPFIAVDREQASRQPELQRLESATSPVIVAADHYQLLPNSTEFDIRTTAPGVVCLTEGQASDFIALANGRSVDVLTVNRAFKGIYLDQPGNYHVEFRFQPHLWRMSLGWFWFSAGMLSILGALEFRRVRRLASAKA